MSHLLKEAVKLYEDIRKAENGIAILEKIKEEMIKARDDKIDEFIETQIIPAAKAEGYEVCAYLGDSLFTWEFYKREQRKDVLRMEKRVVLYKDGKERIEMHIRATDEPEVILKPLIQGAFGPQLILSKDGFLTWRLDLDSPRDSLKQYIQKYETEIYAPQKKMR